MAYIKEAWKEITDKSLRDDITYGGEVFREASIDFKEVSRPEAEENE